jgi:outer membrane protein assembly factor BamB
VSETCQHHPGSTVRRRRFLQAGVATVAAAGAGLVRPGSAVAAGPQRRDRRRLAFALISDTHLSLTDPANGQRMALVWNSIAAADPDFVLHCGDITDTGFSAEFDLYEALVPQSLADRVYYTPGNHEVRWDESAEEVYHHYAGPAPYSFTAGGVHFVASDAAQLLQEPAHYGRERLDWLEHDLSHAGRDVPSVVFQHHPMGDQYLYVDDQERFFDLATRHNVRALFTGHLHKQAVQHMNGLTQVVLDAVKVHAVYYWVERMTPASGAPVLQVTRVDVAGDGTETRTPVTAVALSGHGDGGRYRPSAVLAAARPGQVRLDVRVPRRVTPVLVEAQFVAQEAFSGTATAAWTPLRADFGGQRWTGELDTTALPPGPRRLQTRVQASDGSWWDDLRSVRLPAHAPAVRVRWELAPVGGSVQGALAHHDDLVVAASTTGSVVAVRVSRHGARRNWATRTGPVYRRPSFTGDGRTLLVPSSDHRVTALRAADGRRRWSRDLGAPVLASPLVARIDGRELAFVTAGHRLFCLAPDSGYVVWSVDNHGFFAGRAGTDGTNVYLGSGDGRFRAYSASTGAQLWEFAVTPDPAPHVRLLYGAWDQTVAVMDDTVLASTVATTWGLDTATGTARWSLPGSVMYAPPVVLDDGSVLLIQERGKTVRVRGADGTVVWQAQIPFAVLNGGPVADDTTAWVQGATGQVVAVDLGTGALDRWTQLSGAYTFATPVLLDDLLVTADQDGIVRGIATA